MKRVFRVCKKRQGETHRPFHPFGTRGPGCQVGPHPGPDPPGPAGGSRGPEAGGHRPGRRTILAAKEAFPASFAGASKEARSTWAIRRWPSPIGGCGIGPRIGRSPSGPTRASSSPIRPIRESSCKILRGLSCRSYGECAETIPAAFGLSPSSISRRFIRASARKLQQLCERRLESYDLVALFLDGKTFAEDEMVIALGITLSGHKVILGFIQTGTENERVCSDFLHALLERGLRIDQGLLCIIDGAKGLHKAIQKVFGSPGPHPALPVA